MIIKRKMEKVIIEKTVADIEDEEMDIYEIYLDSLKFCDLN